VDLDGAAMHWRRAADEGHAVAMWELGHLYAHRIDDPAQAAHWYLEAGKHGRPSTDELRRLEPRLRALADAGHTRARTMLGVALAFHLGVRPAAVEELERSAADGDPIAQRTLGYLLESGDDPEPERAAQLYRAAAEAGDGIAAYNVGVSATDTTDAITWLGRAAAAGVSQAHPRLADRLARAGRDTEALRHYVLAAESGDARCMFEAADRYRDGRGTPVDLVQSLRWYLAMLNHGDGDGIHQGHQIVDRMTDQQILDAGRQSGRTSEAETFLRMRQH
jgi:TPR repeat protein